MNLYIELEIYNREFDSKLLLGLEAARRGINVLIGHRDIIYNLAINNKIPPGIIHMKDANSTHERVKKLKELKKKKFVFTAQDEESGLLDITYEKFAQRRFGDSKSFKFIKYFFCWGKRDYKFIGKKFNNAKLTGSPRFDLYRDAKKEKFNKKRILIVSSFNTNGLRSFAERIYSQLSDRKLFKNETEKFAYNIESIHVLKIYSFVKLIRFLISRFKNYKIILRPHPAEKKEDWEKLINLKSDNFYFDNYSTLEQSIKNSSVIIQNGCTSAIESVLLNKPCISFVQKNWTEDTLAKFPNSLGIMAKNHNDIEKIINFKKYKNDKKFKKILSKRLLYNSKIPAYEKQVEYFEKIYNEKFNSEFDMSLRLTLILKKFFRKYRDKIARRKKTVMEEKFPEFRNDEIQNKIKELSLRFKKTDFRLIKYSILSERLLFLKK